MPPKASEFRERTPARIGGALHCRSRERVVLGSDRAWDAKAAYNKGDRVSHNGLIFEAVQSHKGNGDTGWISAPNLWQKIA